MNVNIGLFVTHVLGSLGRDVRSGYPDFWEDEEYAVLRA